MSLFWIVRFSYSVNSIVVTSPLKLARSSKARLPQYNTVRKSYNPEQAHYEECPPVRAGDEKHTSSATRWVWVSLETRLSGGGGARGKREPGTH